MVNVILYSAHKVPCIDSLCRLSKGPFYSGGMTSMRPRGSTGRRISILTYKGISDFAVSTGVVPDSNNKRLDLIGSEIVRKIVCIVKHKGAWVAKS